SRGSLKSSKTGKRIKTLYLYESGSKKHTGHVGGLAVSKKHLWVASGKNVYKIPLSTILHTKRSRLRLTDTGSSGFCA
ncbi:hypothetical protein ABEW73_32965, partial [Paenibacillus lautus]